MASSNQIPKLIINRDQKCHPNFLNLAKGSDNKQYFEAQESQLSKTNKNSENLGFILLELVVRFPDRNMCH